MKKILFYLSIAVLAPVSQAYASHTSLNVGINVGVPVVSGYVAAPVVVATPPEFVAPPELGFYVAVGVPYDLFFYGNRYYLSRGNVWYSSEYYNGPWVTTSFRNVPYGLRRLPAERVHYFRDRYYHNHDRHEFRHFSPVRHESGREGHGRGREGHDRGWEGHGR